MVTHLEKLWCALWISQGWYETWIRYKDYPTHLPEGTKFRRYALKSKTIGLLEFDRTINNYGKSADEIVNIFVYGDKYGKK